MKSLLCSTVLALGLAGAAQADEYVFQTVTIPGRYETRMERIEEPGRWVEEQKVVETPGRWETQVQSVEIPGRYETVERQVWVEGRWVERRGAAISFGGKKWGVSIGVPACEREWIPGHHETVCEQVWIPPRCERRETQVWVPGCSRVETVRVWKPGCSTTRPIQVWIPARTEVRRVPAPRRSCEPTPPVCGPTAPVKVTPAPRHHDRGHGDRDVVVVRAPRGRHGR
jgi:hypothetical protein